MKSPLFMIKYIHNGLWIHNIYNSQNCVTLNETRYFKRCSQVLNIKKKSMHANKIILKLPLWLFLNSKWNRICNNTGKNVGQTLIWSIMNVFDHEKWAFQSKVEPQVNLSFQKQSVKSYWAIGWHYLKWCKRSYSVKICKKKKIHNGSWTLDFKSTWHLGLDWEYLLTASKIMLWK